MVHQEPMVKKDLMVHLVQQERQEVLEVQVLQNQKLLLELYGVNKIFTLLEIPTNPAAVIVIQKWCYTI
jgi:hypothetical protein